MRLQGERRAALEAQWQKVEVAQRDERLALHQVHERERSRPFARASMAVLALFDRVPVIRTVLGPLYRNPKLNVEERQRLENEALDRRYERERTTLDRRLKALSRVEVRENKSLARDQRRVLAAERELSEGLGKDREAFRENADDLTKKREQEQPKQSPKQDGRRRRPRGMGYRPD